MSPRRARAWIAWTCSLAVWSVAGCGKTSDLKPVSGRVLVNGKPAVGAAVVFHPMSDASENSRPVGQVDEQGEFHLTTRKSGDGAMPGEYRVTVTWFVSAAEKRAREGDENPVRNLIPEHYSRPESTPLKTKIPPEGDKPLVIEINTGAARR